MRLLGDIFFTIRFHKYKKAQKECKALKSIKTNL